KKEQELKNVILGLTSDFEKHPKIKTDLRNLNGMQAQIITSEKYYSFHQRGNKYKKNGWKKIEKKFGTNLVFQLSKVKYNENYASFYYSYHCGGLCASGNIIIMEKIKGEWKVLKGFELWVS